MNLDQVSKEIRKKIFLICCQSGGGHIAPSFSCTEILVSLYFNKMNVNKYNLDDEDRDRFILSKGHAAIALYSVLNEMEIISDEELNKFCQYGGVLGAHPESSLIPGIEYSSGSLGHGLSYGAGIALAGKMDNKDYNTYVLLSDGECQEGSVWEAVLFAVQHQLDNLIVVVDYNGLQSLGKTNEILTLDPFAEKWQSFGWNTIECDGHKINSIVDSLKFNELATKKPIVVIAHTIKGKGVSFMENQPLWHYRIPTNDTEVGIACDELGISEDEYLEFLK